MALLPLIPPLLLISLLIIFAMHFEDIYLILDITRPLHIVSHRDARWLHFHFRPIIRASFDRKCASFSTPPLLLGVASLTTLNRSYFSPNLPLCLKARVCYVSRLIEFIYYLLSLLARYSRRVDFAGKAIFRLQAKRVVDSILWWFHDLFPQIMIWAHFAPNLFNYYFYSSRL